MKQRSAIQPSGHHRLLFLPRLTVLENRGDYDPVVIDLMAAVATMRPRLQTVTDVFMQENYTEYVLDTLHQPLCKGLERDYVKRCLNDDLGILISIQDRSLHRKTSRYLRILGFATFAIETRGLGADQTREMEVNVICSRPDYKQIGANLMNAVLDLAAAAHCESVTLDAVPSAEGFYLKQGFYQIPGSNSRYARMRYDLAFRDAAEQASYLHPLPWSTAGAKTRRRRKLVQRKRRSRRSKCPS